MSTVFVTFSDKIFWVLRKWYFIWGINLLYTTQKYITLNMRHYITVCKLLKFITSKRKGNESSARFVFCMWEGSGNYENNKYRSISYKIVLNDKDDGKNLS